ncbi:hypothetical protein [Vibrio phage vB_VmeM-Yong XC32]|nr:hypothetical protein [Vibrio phage vB_VmeM-Yong XC31]QAX96575.1 hypothetical protein [Vibrio phage vB_VmeM-Yong XC32]QAX96893.1 hypothetical protein [Vibrio phage vB_VmeM-Yong MS31]QAX97198.1 hypothetical protein [Vibrio phage vB_VmeM-Yong MS32]
MRNGDILPEDKEDLLKFLLPHAYPKGTSRKVFDLNGGKFCFSMRSPLLGEGKEDNYSQPKVVKVACFYESGRFYGISDNIREWDVWSQVRDKPELAKWFCPVADISDCGRYLVMLKCDPIAPEDIPEMIPDFLEDVHDANWGMLTHEGVTRPVMLDYGHIRPKYIPSDFQLINQQKKAARENGLSDADAPLDAE